MKEYEEFHMLKDETSLQNEEFKDAVNFL